MKDPRVKELDDQSLVWLIVGAAGFWIGASFITGPLAWIFGSKMREKYRALGLQPGGAATGAFIIGIVTTVLTVLAFLAIAMMIVLFAGFLAIPVTH